MVHFRTMTFLYGMVIIYYLLCGHRIPRHTNQVIHPREVTCAALSLHLISSFFFKAGKGLSKLIVCSIRCKLYFIKCLLYTEKYSSQFHFRSFYLQYQWANLKQGELRVANLFKSMVLVYRQILNGAKQF